jgi:hypothetical protein
MSDITLYFILRVLQFGHVLNAHYIVQVFRASTICMFSQNLISTFPSALLTMKEHAPKPRPSASKHYRDFLWICVSHIGSTSSGNHFIIVTSSFNSGFGTASSSGSPLTLAGWTRPGECALQFQHDLTSGPPSLGINSGIDNKERTMVALSASR